MSKTFVELRETIRMGLISPEEFYKEAYSAGLEKAMEILPAEETKEDADYWIGRNEYRKEASAAIKKEIK